MIRAYAAASSRRVVVGLPVVQRRCRRPRSRPRRPRTVVLAASAGRRPTLRRRRAPRRSAGPGHARPTLPSVAGAKPSVSPACGARLSTTHELGSVCDERARAAPGPAGAGAQGVPRSGPKTTQSAACDRLERLRAGRRVGRVPARRTRLAGGGRDLDLAAHGGRARPGRSGSTPRTCAAMSSGRQRHRQHPARARRAAADPVEPLDRVAEQLPQRRRSAGCRPRGRAARRRSRTGAGAPGPRCGPTRRRRTARPAPAAGRLAAARRARGAADPTSRRCRRRSPRRSGRRRRGRRRSSRSAVQATPRAVAAAEGDHGPGARRATPIIGLGHSRPRSRWTARVSTPRSLSRSPISSAIATLRCLPPVQPTARSMNRLRSRQEARRRRVSSTGT